MHKIENRDISNRKYLSCIWDKDFRINFRCWKMSSYTPPCKTSRVRWRHDFPRTTFCTKLHLFCSVLVVNSKYSIQIVKHVILHHQVINSCQFQLYDIVKCKFLNYRPWENPVVKCDDLESGHTRIISIVLKKHILPFHFRYLWWWFVINSHIYVNKSQ